MTTLTESPPPPVSRPHSALRRTWPFLVLLLLVGAAAWWWFGRSKPAPAAAPSFSVQVTRAERRAMPVVLDSVGRVQASATVEVRPQTGGVLRQVFIRDGERVVAGQKLFALDTQPLDAALAQAKAQWARDQALADDAAAAQARLKPLAEKEYVSAREYETAVGSFRAAKATANATRAQIEQARIALGYATITAPIGGRAGAVLVKPGNLVSAAGTTPLVVINALSPVELAFSIPQTQLRRLRDAVAAGTLQVEARDSGSGKRRARGELVFIDNALGDASGSVTVKARFANADEALWPGEFYAVRVTLQTDDAAITVAERALQQGQSGAYVYVVEGGKAKLRNITVDRVLDGLAVVTKGLDGGETLLAGVPNNLRDGSAVRVAAAASGASSPAVASAASASAASAPADAR